MSPDPARQRAATVIAAALAEVGYAGSIDSGLPTMDVPPMIAYKAHMLGLQSLGREQRTFDEWPRSLLAFHADNPYQLAGWRAYFDRHGIAP